MIEGDGRPLKGGTTRWHGAAAHQRDAYPQLDAAALRHDEHLPCDDHQTDGSPRSFGGKVRVVAGLEGWMVGDAASHPSGRDFRLWWVSSHPARPPTRAFAWDQRMEVGGHVPDANWDPRACLVEEGEADQAPDRQDRPVQDAGGTAAGAEGKQTWGTASDCGSHA